MADGPRVSTRAILDGEAPERVQHFPGDVTATAVTGSILGHDGYGRPFEVAEAVTELVEAPGHFDGDGCTFPTEGHMRTRTAVRLRYATPETLQAALQQRGGAR